MAKASDCLTRSRGCKPASVPGAAAGAQIYINGVARATTFVNDTQVSMPMGGGDAGGLITVVNPGPGGGASNALAFVVHWAYLPVARR